MHSLHTHAYASLTVPNYSTVRTSNAVRCHLDLSLVVGPAWNMVHLTEVVVHHGAGCWHEHLPQHLEHSNFMVPLLLLSSSISCFKLHSFLISLLAALGKSLCHSINCCFHLCSHCAFLLLPFLRRSMLLRTCCGNSFILQLLCRCGAAPRGWPMLLTWCSNCQWL